MAFSRFTLALTFILENVVKLNVSSDISTLKEFSDFYNISGCAMQKYFHISYEVTKWNRMKAWHTDHSMEHAGLIYLNPNPPSTAISPPLPFIWICSYLNFFFSKIL